jgi:hypothetical protein
VLRKLSLLVVAGIVSATFALPVENLTTSGKTPTDLANYFGGSGITISNVTFQGTSQSAGTYTGLTVPAQGKSVLENGVVLSSGSVEYLNNTVNTSASVSSATGSGSDADLRSLIPGYSVNDATSISFDFSTSPGVGNVTSSFWYVFGSEEYNEFVGSPYNDVFGFFLDGTNVATIPSTTTPVSINNVNADLNSGYYNNNDLPSGATPFATEMDGFTTPLYAEFTTAAGSTHHLKLAIADAGDQSLDSWVLLGANSFQDAPHDVPSSTDVPEPSSMALMGFGMLSLLGFGLKQKKVQ